MSGKKLAIVTGGNKGIGLAVARGLAKKFDGDVCITFRDPALGKEAVENLGKEGVTVTSHQLDITKEDTVKAMRDFVKDKYGGIDILINNAGFAFKQAATEPFGQQAEVTVNINYFGTKQVCDYLFPLLKPGARVVNVSSSAGWLQKWMKDGDLKKKIATAYTNLTVAELDDIMTDYIKIAKAGTHGEKGWPNSTYMASKIGLSALSIIQQREFDSKDKAKDIVVNHIHPGYVDTDMTSHKGPLTPDDGAKSTIFAALLPPKTEIRGKYIWEDCSIRDWA